MLALAQSIVVLSCGVLLCLGLSNAASGADEMKAGQADQKGTTLKKPSTIIQGDLLRMEYGTYFVKQKDGKEIELETNKATQMMGQIKKGDRIVAIVNDLNQALSIHVVP